MSPALVLGLLVTGVAGGAVGWGRLRPIQVPRDGTWIAVPVVAAEPGVDLVALDRAIGWWAARGQPYERTLFVEQATVRVVVDPRLDECEARTRVWASVDGVIVGAVVRLSPEVAGDTLTIAHELGHVAGWQHPIAPPSGHLMNPWRPGWNGRGLRGR